uniref:Pentatricopeptide repeat-containing protein At2g22070 n=1 Tax=Anthurium amnicola TaxID=1678845 RepID=A0A1D1Z3F0_9ARAE
MELFGRATNRDVVTWNVITMGWVQNGMFEEACTCFWAMRREGTLPDEASFSTALHASAGSGALGRGVSIHDQIIKAGFMNNPCVGSSLITMYAKCGDVDDAHRVFQEMEGFRNVVSWTAMIDAYQQHGRGSQVIELFDKMLGEGLVPDYITYVCVLSACSHGGLVDEGFKYFNLMSEAHGMTPGYEHFACIVDMLGRAGCLSEARAFIDEMPLEPDASIWGALLGACRNYGNLEMGKEAAYKLFEMEPHNSGNYVLLFNMYTRHGKLEEAEEVRRLMGLHMVRKETSCSWIDVKNRTHVFKVHDRSHDRTDEIYRMLGTLEDLVKKKGYVAEAQSRIDGVEEYREHNLWYHSERLALAFGLISLPPDAPIRIKKNLRTCGDCHTVMKSVSEIFKRVIVVRDTNRFHQFTNGSCSCGDYW